MAEGRSNEFRSIYFLCKLHRVWIGVGLAANWTDLVKHRRLDSHINPPEGSVIHCSVADPRLTEQDQRTRAKKLKEARDSDGSCWGKFPMRATSAGAVLKGPDFLDQVDQAFQYASETVGQFRGVGYVTDAK
jgi:hypothetical protein